MRQLSLMDGEHDRQAKYRPRDSDLELRDKFRGALVFSAVGDALGWPTEFGRYPAGVKNRDRAYPHREFVEWNKRIGGRWWGYDDILQPGAYSDDTQLSLATARCIDNLGEFDPEQFALFELPLWLAYERGGGRSIKLAARSIVSTSRDWWMNFYSRKSKSTRTEYRNAGANGAAMRVLPVSLTNFYDEQILLRDVFMASIPTHGHPRALLGAQIFASLIGFLLRREDPSLRSIPEFIDQIIDTSFQPLLDSQLFEKWLSEWNKKPQSGRVFEEVMQETRKEARRYNRKTTGTRFESDWDFYRFTGADSEPFRGSGLSTVFVAVFLFLKYSSDPTTALLTAVNALGSDTDTIANMVCALLGSHHGTTAIPDHLYSRVQDRDYIIATADRLWELVIGISKRAPVAEDFDRDEAILRVFAWEIGLHEMFWDALEVGSRLVHPALGAGIIARKEIKEIPRRGYHAKLIEVVFDYGQSCTFHSRVNEEGRVSGSIANEVRSSLKKSLWNLA